MWRDKYRQVLGVPGFRSVLLLGLLAKLPVVAIPVVLTLHVALGLDHGYGQAGLVAGAWTTGVTIGAPFQGRFIDRRGLRAMLLIAVLGQGAFWGLAPLMSFPVFVAGALLSGLVLVPGSTVIRLAIAGLVPEEHRHTAFALDSTLSSLSYMGGPALAVAAATQVSTEAALLGLGTALVVSNLALVLRNPQMEKDKEPENEASESGPEPVKTTGLNWLTLPLITVFACTLASGAIIAGYEVAIVATLRSEGQIEWTSLILLLSGICSVAGGLVFGALPRSMPVALATGLLSLSVLPLGLVGHWWLLAVAVIPTAVLYSPVFASTATAASELSGKGNRATVMSIYGAAISAGSALGAPLAGAAYDASGSVAAFAVTGALGAVVAVLALAVVRSRPEPATAPQGSEPALQPVPQER
ncbi:MFS transporter [Streptomyces sp. ISL-86]|uniref:MFS transporter n=1 Tax=Streptomyces sp. ISL-86 TaxID=2819187 RepID=UPI001BEC3C82|nr:MFS transporter [Streptomyces sp. ISL-86]MBT2458742.1 MFS transporter [Streptomyces sp. ISL-86]